MKVVSQDRLLQKSTHSRLILLSLLVFLLLVTSFAFGQKSNLPTAAQASPDKASDETAAQAVAEAVIAPEVYIVRKGDSLSRIARRHGISLQALVSANGLDPQKYIHPGQKLLIIAAAADNSGITEAQRIIQTALKYRGVRYRYGGMSSRGFDCSGLVTRVMQINGYDLPHNSGALYKHGQPVKKSELKAGDLVFFKTVRNKPISHVGLYIGEGKFVHASSGKGRVRVDTLMSGYYARTYVGARRIILEAAPAPTSEEKRTSLSIENTSNKSGRGTKAD